MATAATAIASASFQANWQAATGATSYRLDVSTSNTFGAYVAGYQDLNVNNVTTYAVTGLAPNTPYYYRVRATNAAGASADSNVIALATLPVHTVRFTCSAGGHLSGALMQVVDHGADTAPVTALADSGYRFIEWNGTDNSYGSLENPLSVPNVAKDMTIRATFTHSAPTLRITNPVQDAVVWGRVFIKAEVSNEVALSPSISWSTTPLPGRTAGPRCR